LILGSSPILFLAEKGKKFSGVIGRHIGPKLGLK